MQDVTTLGVVNVRYCGYIAVVKVEGKETKKVSSPSQSIDFLDQPEGGANALNINRYSLMCEQVLCKAINHLSWCVLLYEPN